jgi:hypothetical protein
MERGEIAGLGRIIDIRCPLAGQLVWLVAKLEVLQQPPDFQVMPHLVDTQVALDVASP